MHRSCWRKVNLWSKSLALVSMLYFIGFLASSQLFFLAFYSKVYQSFCLYSQFPLSEKMQLSETCWLSS